MNLFLVAFIPIAIMGSLSTSLLRTMDFQIRWKIYLVTADPFGPIELSQS